MLECYTLFPHLLLQFQYMCLFQAAAYFAFSQLMAIASILVLVAIIETMILFATLSLVMICISNVRYHQMALYVRQISVPCTANTLHIIRYLRRMALSIAINSDAGHVYGNALLLLLCTNIPMHGSILAVSTIRTLSLRAKLLLLIIGCTQAFFIFAVHFHAAGRVIQHHRIVKRWYFFSLTTKSTDGLRTRVRYRLAVHVEQFHSNNPPVLSFGRYGSISYANFAKYLLYYVKSFLFAYKLFHNSFVNNQDNV